MTGLLVLAAVVLQCRRAPRTMPPDWRSVSGDFQQYVPVQMATADSGLFRSDPAVRRLLTLYPKAWREATAWLGLKAFGSLVLFDWLLGLLTLAVASAGLLALGLSLHGDARLAAFSVLLSLAGQTDPFNHYFVTLASAAAPREQALALLPWILVVMVLRTKNKVTLPWECLLVGIAAHIHPATALYGAAAIAAAWAFAPESRPKWDASAAGLAATGGVLLASGLAELVIHLRSITPPPREAAAALQPHYWPVSKLIDPVKRAAATAFWTLRPYAVVAGFLFFARPWSAGRRAGPAARLLLASGAALCGVALFWGLVPHTPLGLTLFTVGQRAFYPAILVLAALGSRPWSAEADGSRPWRSAWAALALLLLLRSLDLKFSAPTPYSRAEADAIADVAAQCRARTPTDALILIPTELSALRWLSQRAAFGDERVYAGVAVVDEAIRSAYGNPMAELLDAYSRKDLAAVERVGARIGARFAVVPSDWNSSADRVAYRNETYSLVRLKASR
ncbi:MAG: hypothetical protein HY078_14920 [Elusimicrobia bacterium]|nr:hypothetical protein [Elusimicrobiota bacterium]